MLRVKFKADPCLDVVSLDSAAVVKLVRVEVVDDVADQADVLRLLLELAHQADAWHFRIELVQGVAGCAGQVDAICMTRLSFVHPLLSKSR